MRVKKKRRGHHIRIEMGEMQGTSYTCSTTCRRRPSAPAPPRSPTGPSRALQSPPEPSRALQSLPEHSRAFQSVLGASISVTPLADRSFLDPEPYNLSHTPYPKHAINPIRNAQQTLLSDRYPLSQPTLRLSYSHTSILGDI